MSSLIDFLLDHFEAVGILVLLAVAFWSVQKRRARHQAGAKLLQKAVQLSADVPLSLHPQVDPALCAGCGACTKVCPEGDILNLINHQAVLVSPTKCVGHGECERACPYNAITLVFGTKTRGMDIPRITSDYETNVPGLYIAGELGGMGLIRNAVKQGEAAARHAFKNLQKNASGADVDLLIVGAGPAGLAACLVAAENGKKYVCLEQNSFGGTVYNFPRQKFVMTAPLELPIYGKMKFKRNKVSKEELLQLWSAIRQKNNLNIKERSKFESLEKVGEIFHVKINGQNLKAHKVILATGVRGSPRRLGLPNEDLPKVTYNLIDAEQYQGQNVVVVGGGNAGVEAAQSLANPAFNNKVTLLVRGPKFDRCNEENQNAINQMAAEGLLEIWFNSSVMEIHMDRLLINRDGVKEGVPNDFLFIFAGADMPQKFLMSLGIQIEKKFGEPLKSSKPAQP